MFDERRRGIGIDRSQPLKPIPSMAGSTRNLSYESSVSNHNDNNNFYTMKNGFSANNIEDETKDAIKRTGTFTTVNSNIINNNNISNSRRSKSTIGNNNNNIASARNAFQRKSAQSTVGTDAEKVSNRPSGYSTERPAMSKIKSRYASQPRTTVRQSQGDVEANIINHKDSLSKSITTLNLNSSYGSGVIGNRLNNKNNNHLNSSRDDVAHDSQSVNGVTMKLNPIVTRKSPNVASTYSRRSRTSDTNGGSPSANTSLPPLSHNSRADSVNASVMSSKMPSSTSQIITERRAPSKVAPRRATQVPKPRGSIKAYNDNFSSMSVSSRNMNPSIAVNQ